MIPFHWVAWGCAAAVAVVFLAVLWGAHVVSSADGGRGHCAAEVACVGRLTGPYMMREAVP